MSDLRATLPATLKAARLELGLTQLEVADGAHVKCTNIMHYEAGRNLPSLETFARLCDVLILCADDVLGAA